jgi:hypothetical protein
MLKRMLCWFGSHEWSKWKYSKYTPAYDERACARCGKTQSQKNGSVRE